MRVAAPYSVGCAFDIHFGYTGGYCAEAVFIYIKCSVSLCVCWLSRKRVLTVKRQCVCRVYEIIPGWKLIPTHNNKEISDQKIITETKKKEEEELAPKLCITHIHPTTAESESLIQYHVGETRETAKRIVDQENIWRCQKCQMEVC